MKSTITFTLRTSVYCVFQRIYTKWYPRKDKQPENNIRTKLDVQRLKTKSLNNLHIILEKISEHARILVGFLIAEFFKKYISSSIEVMLIK